MRLAEVEKIINKPSGYRVAFEHARDGVLISDQFPARDEEPFTTEEEAWEWARKFAEKTYGQCVNIYVITPDGQPAVGYREKLIGNR